MFDFKILLSLFLPVFPFVGTTLIAMFYQFILSFIIDGDYDLHESIKQCALFAFKPTMYMYFLIFVSILFVLLGYDPTVN